VEVALIVMPAGPTGVPGSAGAFVDEPELQPPSVRKPSSIAAVVNSRKRVAPARLNGRSTKANTVSPRSRWGADPSSNADEEGAVVLMVSVVAAAAAPGVRLAGLKVQVLSAGSPEQAKVTRAAKFPTGLMVIWVDTLWPRVTVSDVVPAATVKSGAEGPIVKVLEAVFGWKSALPL
jgi:hypothetical protein